MRRGSHLWSGGATTEVARLALQSNGMAVLGSLGLLPAEAVSARIDSLDIRGATGRRLLSVRMPDLGAGLDHAIAIRRTDLHRLLLDAVAGVASVDRRFGCAAVPTRTAR